MQLRVGSRATLLALAMLSLLLPVAPYTRHAMKPRARTAAVSRAAVSMAAPVFTFEMADDRSKITFGCRQQSLTMVKPEEGGSLYDFIGSNSDAIVMSSWDAGQVHSGSCTASLCTADACCHAPTCR